MAMNSVGRGAARLLVRQRPSLLGSAAVSSNYSSPAAAAAAASSSSSVAARSFFQSAASECNGSISSSSYNTSFVRHDSSHGRVPSDFAAAAVADHKPDSSCYFDFTVGRGMRQSSRPVHTLDAYYAAGCCRQLRLLSSSPAAAKVEEQSSGWRDDKDKEHKGTDELERSHYWGVVRKTETKKDGTPWPWHCFKPGDTYSADVTIDVEKHYKPTAIIDRLAYRTVRVLRLLPKAFFREKYGCHAMMLETVAAVPGMVGGMLLHCKSLRRFEESGGWIRTLLDEAENERMHLMTLIQVIKPTAFERLLVFAVQGAFFNCYFILYVLSPQLAHRFCGYLEEEAVESYTHFLNQINDGTFPNGPAPPIAIDYWQLPQDATMKDVVTMIRADECHHRDLNHFAADIQKQGKQLRQEPAPVGFH